MSTENGLALWDHYTRAIRIAMARDHAHKHPADRMAAEIALTRYYLLQVCNMATANDETDPAPTHEELVELERGRATDWLITRDKEEART